MTKSKGIQRLRRPPGMPIMDWLAANSHLEPGPLDTPCVVWDGARSTNGYGRVSVGAGRMVTVSRLAWTRRHGPIPPKTPCVLHRCDNRPCWADGHLWLGTNADNTADMIAKGRRRAPAITHCPRKHLYDKANTRLYNGSRNCRACNRDRMRKKATDPAYRAAHAAQVRAHRARQRTHGAEVSVKLIDQTL